MIKTNRLYYSGMIVMGLIMSTLFIGCAQKPSGVVASDGVYTDKIVITWNAERVPEGGTPKTDHYIVFRADVADGPYAAVSGNIVGTSYYDASITPDKYYYYYQVIGYNKLGMKSAPSAYDAGYAGNTNALFLQECLDTENSAITKLDEKDPSTDIGTKVTITGDISGTCQKDIASYILFWKKTKYTYINYQDTVTKGFILNGTLSDITGTGSEGNGTVKGTIDITGDHHGYVAYDLKVTNLQRSGGGYWVSQDNHPEEWFAWYSNVPPETKPTADIPDQQTAKSLLYAAYSGIAYDKDTAIYGLMLEDNMNLLESLAMDIISGDAQLLTKAVGMLAGQKTTFKITTTNGTFSFTIDPSGVGSKSKFTGDVSFDFNDIGYEVWATRAVVYTGTSGGPELTGKLTGYYSINLNTFDIEILFSKVEFVLNEGLKASYESPVFDVNYHQFKIAFDVNYGPNDPVNPQPLPLNVKIVPQIGSVPDMPDIDNRDYTFDGAFTTTINAVENTYTYGKGFHYVQNQTDTERFVNINGLLSVTGLDGVVLIETGADISLDPIGRWIAGSLVMTGVTTNDTVTFINDGSAQFSGHLGDWTVPNWQEVLSPF
jgi:hypothetical protein